MDTQTKSLVTLIRRWLMNWHVNVWAFYEPILKHVLEGWSVVTAYVILDGVMIFGAAGKPFEYPYSMAAVRFRWSR